MSLHVARVLYPVKTLGPGQRIAVWLQGCSLHCPGCISPDLWERSGDTRITVSQFAQALLSVAQQQPVDGLTVSGGEPFEQTEGLVSLLRLVKPQIGDVLVYTGRTCEQLAEQLPAPLWQEAQTLIDVLIDGPYMDERNDNMSALRGSNNQRIWYLNPDMKFLYEPYLACGRVLQNYHYDHTMLSIGIYNKEG